MVPAIHDALAEPSAAVAVAAGNSHPPAAGTCHVTFACGGPCPAYRVLLTFGGLIRFWSEDASGAPTASDSVAPRLFMNAENDSMVAAVLALPDNIQGSSMCGRSVTDAPYARLTLFTNHGTKRIVDYQGCLGAPPVLRRFELLVDSVTRVDRWTHKP